MKENKTYVGNLEYTVSKGREWCA